ncbi:MAG: ANTAR domain-containing protein [Natronosporangium sp.]
MAARYARPGSSSLCRPGAVGGPTPPAAEVLTEQLQGALNSRIVIEQAKGAIAQALGVSVDEAFTRMRGYARAANRRLSDVAHTVVTDPTSIPELAAQR